MSLWVTRTSYESARGSPKSHDYIVVVVSSSVDGLCGVVAGILAPILSEVLYAIGPMWPLAAFGLAMALVAVFAGKWNLVTILALRHSYISLA